MKISEARRWQHAELRPTGDVTAIIWDRLLSRCDKSSRLIWSVRERFRHTLWSHGDEIHALTYEDRVVDDVHPESETLVDLIRVLSLGR